MTRPLVEPTTFTDRLRSEIESFQNQYTTTVAEAEALRERECSTRERRISALETIREPLIGPGEMPFLIAVEWFSEGGLREHGHIYGRTVRDNDSQTWILYNSRGEALTQPTDWISMISTRLLRNDKAVRLMMPVGYVELAHHESLYGIDTMPEFAGKKAEEPPAPQLSSAEVARRQLEESRAQGLQFEMVKSDSITPEQRQNIRVVVTKRLVAGDVISLIPNPDSGTGRDRIGDYGRIPNTDAVEYEAQRDERFPNYNRR